MSRLDVTAKEKNNMRPDSWPLTGLACDFAFHFRTAMSYRSGYLKIDPTVRVRGKRKLEFSKPDVGKFLVARKLFANSLKAGEVQGVLNFLDEYKLLEHLFPDCGGDIEEQFRRRAYDTTLLIVPLPYDL